MEYALFFKIYWQGLGLGVIISIITVLYGTTRPYGTLLGRVRRDGTIVDRVLMFYRNIFPFFPFFSPSLYK